MTSEKYPLGLDGLQWAERMEMLRAIRETRGNQSAAARKLDVCERKFRRLITKLKIEKSEIHAAV